MYVTFLQLQIVSSWLMFANLWYLFVCVVSCFSVLSYTKTNSFYACIFGL